MQRIVIAVLVALCLPGALATPANARTHRMTFQFAVMVANQYWLDRGVYVHCHPQADVLGWKEAAAQHLLVDDPTTPEMVADVPACTVDVMPWTDEWRTDPDLDQDYCWDIVHEVGHLAGLEHPGTPAAARLPADVQAMLPDTVMNLDGASYPYGCTHPRKFLRHRAHASTLVALAR